MSNPSDDFIDTADMTDDTEKSYEDVDISDLPSWWRNAIEEFERHELQPYQPPRFSDGVFKYTVIERLEEEYNINIDFIGVNVAPNDEWLIRIDGEPIESIGHRRASKGYSIFEMESDEFAEAIAEWISKHRPAYE